MGGDKCHHDIVILDSYPDEQKGIYKWKSHCVECNLILGEGRTPEGEYPHVVREWIL